MPIGTAEPREQARLPVEAYTEVRHNACPPVLRLAELADEGGAGGASTPNAKRLMVGRPLTLGGRVAMWMGKGV
jgi:hypothetical protein